MLSKKKILVAASIAGLMASSSVAMAGAAFPGHDSMNRSCQMNSCKGMGSCKGAKNACGGHKNGCSGKASADTAAKAQDGQLTAK